MISVAFFLRKACVKLLPFFELVTPEVNMSIRIHLNSYQKIPNRLRPFDIVPCGWKMKLSYVKTKCSGRL